MRKPSLALALFVVLVLVALVAPAAAESYTVTLKSGNTFETRYRPREAGWDAGKVVLITELGNSITLRKDQIETVTADSENRGFGRVIDNTTLELGWAANDAPDEAAAAGQTDPMKALAGALEQLRGPEAPVYNMNQFVEPGQTGGVPVGWVGGSGGSAPVNTVIVTGTTPAPTTPPQK